MEESVIPNEAIEAFRNHLRAEEKAENTVEKYLRDVGAWQEWCTRRAGACSRREWRCSKENVIAYKHFLLESGYSRRSVNSMLCSVNAFLHFCGRDDCRVKLLKLQREVFCREEKELTRAEFERLCGAALSAGNRRLYIVSSGHEHRREMERMKLIC